MKDLLILSRYPISINTDVDHDIVLADDGKLSEFFNQKKEFAQQYKYTLFLDGRYRVARDCYIDDMCNRLFSSANIVAGVYSDVILTSDDDQSLSYHCNQSYAPELINKGVFIDSPLMIKSKAYPMFDDNLSILILYDAILSLSMSAPVIRYPSFCFKRNMYSGLLNNEINYISKKYYESK